LSGASTYFVRVVAYNVLGYGDFKATEPASIIPVLSRPSVVNDVLVESVLGDSSSLEVSWSAPDTSGGESISHYLIEWDTVDTFDSQCGDVPEVQRLTMVSTIAGSVSGDIALTIDIGSEIVRTACFNYGASAATIESAINDALSLATSEVSVGKCGASEVNYDFGATYDITWLLDGNVAEFGIASDAPCSGFTVSSGTASASVLTVVDGYGSVGECNIEHMSPLGSTTHNSGPVTISDLTPGQFYFIRVSAVNSHGRSVVAPYSVSVKPHDVPNMPTAQRLLTNSVDSLYLDFATPFDDKPHGNNGDPVTEYNVYWATRIPEVQIITVVDTAATGSFMLSYDGEVTAQCLSYDVSASAMELELEFINSIDDVTVSRSSITNGYEYRVTFIGDAVNGDVSELDYHDDGSCSAIESVTVDTDVIGATGFLPEVMEVITSASDAISGSFGLSWGYEAGFNTVAIGQVNVSPKSRTAISTGVDFTLLLNRGDEIMIGSEVFTVHDSETFSCTELPLSSYHVAGGSSLNVYKRLNHVGFAAVEANSLVVETFDDYTSSINVGDSIYLVHECTVTAIDASSITVDNDVTFSETLSKVTIYTRQWETFNFDVTASLMQDTIRSSDNGPADIKVVRTGPNSMNAYVWTLTSYTIPNGGYSCDVSSPQAPCLKTSNSLVGTAAAVQVTTTQSATVPNSLDYGFGTSATLSGYVKEVQTLTITTTADDVDGTFALDFQSSGNPTTFKHDVTEEDLKTGLESLQTTGIVSVTRSIAPVDFGYVWTVTFETNVGDLPDLELTSSLTGTSISSDIDEHIKGVAPTTDLIINGLTGGAKYYARVSASNVDGEGLKTNHAPTLRESVSPFALHVHQRPDAPSALSASSLSASQVRLSWTNPASNGDAISDYQVEWYSGAAQLETVEVDLTNTGTDTAGYFTISSANVVSARINHDASASAVESAVNNLGTFAGTVSVTRSEPDSSSYSWTIIFNSPGNKPDLSVDDSMLTGTGVSLNIDVTDGVEPAQYGSYQI
jgi:hypothetical protein